MKIAVIGSGISGLGAAYLLSPHHQVTLYEAGSRLGGHSRTLDVKVKDGSETIAVDTGFIVFNESNYPHLTALFKHLQVPTANSHMSFGVSIKQGEFEYGTQSLMGLLACKRKHVEFELLEVFG